MPEFNPFAGLPPENQKLTLWQKLIALPLNIKIGAISALVILFIGGAWVTFALISNNSKVVTPVPVGDSSSGQKKESSKQPSTTPEEKKKEEEKKAESQKPPTQQGGTSGGGTTGGGNSGEGTAPPPTTPPTTPPPSGGFPNASNTGVPAGTSLTNYTGPTYNSSSDIVLENMNFTSTGGYTFTGNNVTIRNSHFASSVLFNGDGITVERNTIIDGVSFSGTAGVTFRYNNVKQFAEDAMHVTSDTGQVSNVTIAGNYINTPTPTCGAHSDGIQVRGVNGLSITGNTFDMGSWQQACGQDALNAAIFLQNANGGNSNMTVSGNYLNGGGYILYLTPGANQTITNNAFGVGQYGFVSNTAGAGDIVNKSGNYRLSDGSPVNF